jgi:uncharacterized protein
MSRTMRLAATLFLGFLWIAHAGAGNPKVRAITAFVKLDRTQYTTQIAQTLQMLRRAKTIFEGAGYPVESIRITTQPFPEYTRGLSRQQALAFFRAYDELAIRESFDPNIGPAMLHDQDDATEGALLGEVLSVTKTLEASLVMADEDGIHWNAIKAAARIVRYVTDHSLNSQGNFNFTATAMLQPYGPFFPGSYHHGEGHQFSVGLESANVVDAVFAATSGKPQQAVDELSKALTRHAVAVEKLGRQIEDKTGWTYMGLDPTPAPLREVSIGAAIEKFSGARFGSSGTMTAAAIITKAVSSVPVKRVGYSGLMVPVLEDSLLAERWGERAYDMDSLLAYSAVCGTGLDTIPLPGDISEERLQRIFEDVATLAFKWHKPLSARLQPVSGKRAGDRTAFDDPFIVNTVIQPLR